MSEPGRLQLSDRKHTESMGMACRVGVSHLHGRGVPQERARRVASKAGPHRLECPVRELPRRQLAQPSLGSRGRQKKEGWTRGAGPRGGGGSAIPAHVRSKKVRGIFFWRIGERQTPPQWPCLLFRAEAQFALLTHSQSHSHTAHTPTHAPLLNQGPLNHGPQFPISAIFTERTVAKEWARLLVGCELRKRKK